MACDFRTRSEPSPDYVVHNLSPVGDQRPPCQLVIHVEMGFSVFEKVYEIARYRSCVHLTGLKRHCARKVQRTDDDPPVSHDLSPGLGQRAVSALLGRKVQNDGAWPHTADHFLGDEDRSALPGNQRCGDDDVSGSHVFGHHFLLLAVELVRLCFGVTAPILSILRSETQLRELGTEALYLLLAGRAGIVPLPDTPEPLCGANNLQPRRA